MPTLALTWFICSCILLNAVRGNEPQQPLASSLVDSSVDQTFVLRHVFYHDLSAPAQQAATFVNFHRPHDEYESQDATWNFTKTIKVRRAGRDVGSNDEPVHVDASSISGTHFAPVTSDKDTVINLATMTYDVYYRNASVSEWHNVSQGFKDSLNFGYDGDGLQGHVFSTLDNSTVIVAFKGTSIFPFETTRANDRLNDNLLFSCCCGTQQPLSWWYGSACDCQQETYTCNATCLTSELTRSDRYYAAAKSIMLNVSQDLFPSASMWAVGHSLGGSLASLMGLTFGIPAVTFEAPPERLAAQRLGLFPFDLNAPAPRGPLAYHFGHTADPIFMGACHGWSASCSYAGFAFESACFTGKRCVYDTVMDKGWSMSVYNHKIKTVISDVLMKYDTVTNCTDTDDECVDCFNWKFT